MTEAKVSDLFSVESVNRDGYVAKLWFQEKYAFLTEDEVEWLIWELRRAAFGNVMTQAEAFPEWEAPER